MDREHVRKVFVQKIEFETESTEERFLSASQSDMNREVSGDSPSGNDGLWTGRVAFLEFKFRRPEVGVSSLRMGSAPRR